MKSLSHVQHFATPRGHNTVHGILSRTTCGVRVASPFSVDPPSKELNQGLPTLSQNWILYQLQAFRKSLNGMAC